MKKISIFSIFLILLILNTNSKAEEWDDLIEVESEIDGFCYFTKMIKPEEEYNLEFESGDYKQYNLKTEENCEDFLNFQKKLKSIKPKSTHLPFNGKITEINEKELLISEYQIKSGKVSQILITKKGIIHFEYKKDDKKEESNYYNEKGNLEFKNIIETKNFSRSIFYNKNKIFEFTNNLKTSSIDLIENNLKIDPSGYYEINLSSIDYIFKIKDNFINSMVIYYKNREYPYAKIYNYKKGKQNGITISRIDKRHFKNKDYYTADLYQNSKKLFKYSIMTDLAFETPYKNGLEHGLRFQFQNKSKFKVVKTKCYLEGKEIDEENTDLYEKCFEYKPDRETHRKIYFNPDQSPNEYHLSYFDLLNEYLKNK